MSNLVIRKQRGTTTSLSSLVLTLGDVWIDITKPTLVVGDGSTDGGIPLAHEIHTHSNATESTAGFLSTADKIKLDALSLSGGIQNLLSNTVPVTAENTINFSTDFTLTDNPGASRTEFGMSSTFQSNISNSTIALIVALA